MSRVDLDDRATLTGAAMQAPRIVATSTGKAAIFSAPSPEPGRENQDAAALISIAPGLSVLAVADGVGGSAGGAQAALLALECLIERVAQADDDALRAPILDGIEAADAAVRGLGIAAGTTLVAAEIHAKRMRAFHVGDSMLLAVGQRGRVKYQTVPHSPVGYAVEAGVLDESEAMLHDERHLVSNVVGAGDMRIEVGPVVRLAPRDTIVLASDGVFDNLEVAEVIDLVRKGPLEAAANHLRAACHSRMLAPAPDLPSKPDDLTFILHRF
jgi:serine/threonine protein phosphatase PrpC